LSFSLANFLDNSLKLLFYTVFINPSMANLPKFAFDLLQLGLFFKTTYMYSMAISLTYIWLFVFSIKKTSLVS